METILGQNSSGRYFSKTTKYKMGVHTIEKGWGAGPILEIQRSCATVTFRSQSDGVFMA